MSSIPIKEECDSCYDNSTDEEVEKFAFATDGFKEVENFAFATGEDDDLALHSDDEDSKDDVLKKVYDEPQGKIAFCCQNCR